MNPALKPDYYYTITGDVVMGNNKNSQQFTAYAESRFPINVPQDIWTQAEGWGPSVQGKISPLFEKNAPGIVPAQFAIGKRTPRAPNA